MIVKFSMSKHNFLFVFRKIQQSKTWKIGVWLRLSKLISKSTFDNYQLLIDNLVNNYTFGVDFIYWEVWINYNKNGIDDNRES